MEPRARLSAIDAEVRESYARNRRVLSFAEYFEELCRAPALHARSAAQYLKDVFDHFGSDEVVHPAGRLRRFRLFDCPWDEGRDRLVGQEDVQARVYRAVCNFVREGRVSKLLLLHGPNGSAKSTLVNCVIRAVEHYSTLPEGALYRFNWVFPTERGGKGGIGFTKGDGADKAESFAGLADDVLDAKLADELRDPPYFLIPGPRRREILGELLKHHPGFVPSDYLLHGDLGHKNRQIFEALLARYRGDYARVLRHVQVERFYVQRRYRQGAVTVEPQMAVDARSRQLTMDRSISSLPQALQSLSLFEYAGDLVDANRGIIDYSDLLKRPLEAYKYLLGTVEHGEVPLDNAILHLDLVFLGSSNEAHVQAFKEIAEFPSFKGRLELIRVPYLLDHNRERELYVEKLRRRELGRHVSPHAAFAAALWATLTRMRKPAAERYPKSIAETVGKLGPLEKADLYADRRAPVGLGNEQSRELVAHLEKIYLELESQPGYEGRLGASPREMHTLLLNAANNPGYACLTPQAVLDEIEELIKNPSLLEFLRLEPVPGGYHESRKFIYQVRDRVLDKVDDEICAALGLVEEAEFQRLFERYVAHATHWLRKERVRNPITGKLEDPDTEMMAEVEKTLAPSGKREEFRADIITRIGAWSIDHPGQRVALDEVFPKLIEKLRDASYLERRKIIAKALDDVLGILAGGAAAAARLEPPARARAEEAIRRLEAEHGYCRACALESLALLQKKRYS